MKVVVVIHLGGLILKLINSRNGKIVFNGRDITNIEEKHMKQIRKDMQVIFQYTQEILRLENDCGGANIRAFKITWYCAKY